MSGTWECQHCKAPVVIRQIRDGRRWPFNQAMQAPEDVAEHLRFVPVRAGLGIVMLPAVDMNPRRIEGIRWYAVRHTCAEWLREHRRKKNAEAAKVDCLADAIIEWFDAATSEVPQQRDPDRAGRKVTR